MHRSIAAAAAVAVVVLLASPAVADGGNQGSGNRDNVGWTDGAGVGANAGEAPTEAAPLPVAGNRAVGRPVCEYEALLPQEAAFANDAAASGMGPSAGTGPGAWYRKMCTEANGMRSGVVIWIAQPARVDPAAIAQRALDYAALPLPGIAMSPPPGRDQLVNLTTFLWLDRAAWKQASASASAGGVTVTTTA